MDWFQAVVLALVQGLTEFLPVSSSAHLILPSQLLGWPDQGLAFDVAVHLGTLVAVVTYFRQDIASVIQGLLKTAQTREMNTEAQLGVAVVVGTIPAVIIGFLFKDFIEQNLRSSMVIAFTTIFFGLLLWQADKAGKRVLKMESLKANKALVIGVAQALALIPGTSRSGITMTAALMLGFDRTTSARFSMLLSIPLIVAASLLKMLDLLASTAPVPWLMIGLGMIVATVSAYACIHYFLKLLEQMGMLPFVIYRLLLGGFLLFFIGLR
ncbi:MAG: undecaprenyl-diphosphate phosphatase [Pseudomonadales bacterium]|nr:undecaprenyl-diphosphate phosphatase [Pseudomonadales bacterium]